MIKGIIFDLNRVLFYFNNLSTPSFVEENVKLIKKLSLKYELGVLSNANEDYKGYLEDRGLSSLFKAIILSETIGFRKPDREIFEIALERMLLTPQEIIFIDDAEENVEMAKKLGMHTILYKNQNQLEERLYSLGIDF